MVNGIFGVMIFGDELDVLEFVLGCLFAVGWV
jgi:hypothetical protein